MVLLLPSEMVNSSPFHSLPAYSHPSIQAFFILLLKFLGQISLFIFSSLCIILLTLRIWLSLQVTSMLLVQSKKKQVQGARGKWKEGTTFYKTPMANNLSRNLFNGKKKGKHKQTERFFCHRRYKT